MYLIQVLLDTEDFVRNKDPQNSKTYLLLCYVKQREAVVEKWLNYVERVKEDKKDFNEVCIEFSQSQPLAMIRMLLCYLPSGIGRTSFI